MSVWKEKHDVGVYHGKFYIWQDDQSHVRRGGQNTELPVTDLISY